jgi:arylsulfatase A-like enzyme
MYDPDQIAAWGNFADSLEGKPNVHRRYRDSFLGELGARRTWAEWATWVARYFGFVTLIDAQIGRILNALEASGRARDTIVVFTTDHGDHIGGHGGIFDKDAMMYQETYHIPFLIRVPGLAGPGHVSQPFTNVDLAATLLELACVEPGHSQDGRSLVPLLKGEAGGWEDDVYCVFNGHYMAYQSRMVTDGAHKYVFNAPEFDELYDLEVDPWELQNLISLPEHAHLVRALRSRLLYWAERTGDPLLANMRDLFVKRTPVGPEEYTPWPGRWR